MKKKLGGKVCKTTFIWLLHLQKHKAYEEMNLPFCLLHCNLLLWAGVKKQKRKIEGKEEKTK